MRVVLALAFAFAFAFALAFAFEVIEVATWIAAFVDSSLIFVLVGLVGLVGLIDLVGLIGLVGLIDSVLLHRTFVSSAVRPPHNLNIANIQTSPNKKVDNILFLFILLFMG
jgi:hypothetical protein